MSSWWTGLQIGSRIDRRLLITQVLRGHGSNLHPLGVCELCELLQPVPDPKYTHSIKQLIHQ